MSYEILGETIKSATSIKLGELFNNPYRYKENITNQQYPNFRIIQVNCNVVQQQRKVESALNTDLRRIQLNYLINIQYRVAEDTERVTNLRQRLDEVGLKLLAEFTELDLGVPTEVTNARYEIVDGVLQFFYNITLYATMEEQDEQEMNAVKLEIEEGE